MFVCLIHRIVLWCVVVKILQIVLLFWCLGKTFTLNPFLLFLNLSLHSDSDHQLMEGTEAGKEEPILIHLPQSFSPHGSSPVAVILSYFDIQISHHNLDVSFGSLLEDTL